MLEDNPPPNITFCDSCVNENKALQPSPSMSDLFISVSAPGKVILHGEHSVVYGKLAVAASLGLRTKLTIAEHTFDVDEQNIIRLDLTALNLMHYYDFKEVQYSLLDQPLPLAKSASSYNWEKPELLNHEELLRSVQDFVAKTAGSSPLNSHQQLTLSTLFYLFTGIFASVNIPIKPFTLKIETDLTISSGSGSSASFAVAVAAAFIQYIRVRCLENQLKNISKQAYKSTRLTSTDLNVFSDKELELISKWAYSAEKIIHGMPSGIDNTICTYGSVVEFRKTSGPKLIQLCELKLVLVNTKVKRDTKRMVNNVMALKARHPQVVDSILNTMDEISQSAIENLKQLNDLNSPQRTTSESDSSVKEVFVKLGELTDMNQHLLQALGVSHPMLDKICEIFKKAGVCGKLTGAGGGGYAIALVPPHVNQEIQPLIDELNAEGFEAILTNLGGAGVTID